MKPEDIDDWPEKPDDWKKLPPWGQAAHLYNRHHLGCPTCVSAGIRGAPASRCADGQALWDAYQQQGTPPHFLWAQRSQSTKARQERHDFKSESVDPGRAEYRSDPPGAGYADGAPP